MMILQDDMLRTSRRFEASGRPILLEERHGMDHAARRDEAGAAGRVEHSRAIAATPAAMRQPLASLRLRFAGWFAA